MEMKQAKYPWRPTVASGKRVYAPRICELLQLCENAGINNSTRITLLKKHSTARRGVEAQATSGERSCSAVIASPHRERASESFYELGVPKQDLPVMKSPKADSHRRLRKRRQFSKRSLRFAISTVCTVFSRSQNATYCAVLQ